jgi:hypothetical protein
LKNFSIPGALPGALLELSALAENCEIEPFYKGIKKILLLELALAGIAG